MPAKKRYPRNRVFPITVADIEIEALQRTAAARGISASDLGHEMLRKCGLFDMVASFHPDDVPFLEQQYSQSGNEGGAL